MRCSLRLGSFAGDKMLCWGALERFVLNNALRAGARTQLGAPEAMELPGLGEVWETYALE